MSQTEQGSISLEEYRRILASGGAPKVVRRKTDEEDLQIACFELALLLQAANPILRWLYHTPNGGGRSSKTTAGRLRAMGVRSGVPDFLNHRQSGGWKGLALEAKSSTGRLSEDQVDWLLMFQQEGYMIGLFRDIDQFQCYLNCYIQGTELPPHLDIQAHLVKRTPLVQKTSRQPRTPRPSSKESP